MPRIEYEQKRFRQATLDVISTATKIMREYAEQGFDLTLRQLYYQFVARDLLANSDKEYKRLGSYISQGRLAGLVDWDSIVDRTRELRGLPHWSSPASIVRVCARTFNYDKWKPQAVRPEVWIEKDALVGVLEGVCNELDIDYFSCRGYTSQSAMWRAAQRLLGYEKKGQRTVIFHLGDHDPSGIDMTRDIRTRLATFGSKVRVERIALNMDQIEEHEPPPNPAKLTDTRAADYIAEYGDESWELDALDPNTITTLIRNEVVGVRDHRKWEIEVAREKEARGEIQEIADNWHDVLTAWEQEQARRSEEEFFDEDEEEGDEEDDEEDDE
ncbi:MAG: hypothetical protein ACYTFG_00140 [Planctomycetota bacterium]|jgi:hypothetical protein